MSFSPVAAATGVVGQADAARDFVDQMVNKYVVKPKNAKGIGGFVFQYEGSSEARQQAEITDHFSEDLSPINDHIAIRPFRLTLRGFVAELIMKKEQGLVGALDAIQNRLSTVPAYLGKYTPTQLAKIQGIVTKAQNVTAQFDQTLARVKNVVGLFDKSIPGTTEQQHAWFKLNALFASRKPLFVESPYGIHPNMIIETLAFIQPEDTNGWSDITVTLKQIRVVDINVRPVVYRNRSEIQRAPAVDNGSTKGKVVPKSLLYQGGKLIGSFFGVGQ